jgi:2,3-bisphosphoglycerate-dependent phosphoglycerate mutase
MDLAGKALHDFPFAVAYSSALQRSMESTELLLKAAHQTHVRRVVICDLNERDYGRLQGLTRSEVLATYGEDQLHRWRRDYQETPPGGESPAIASERIFPILRVPLLVQAARGNVLVCTHGNTLRILVKKLKHLSEKEFSSLDIPTAAILIFKVGDCGSVTHVSDVLVTKSSPGGSLL